MAKPQVEDDLALNADQLADDAGSYKEDLATAMEEDKTYTSRTDLTITNRIHSYLEVTVSVYEYM